MAKVLYENKFILTKKLHAQYCQMCFTKMRKQTKLICLLLALVCLAVAVPVNIFTTLRIVPGILYVLAVYFIFWIFQGYRVSEWINYKNMQRNYGEYIVMQVFFEPVQVKVKTGDTALAFKYTTISKAYETEDLIVLILSTEGMIEHGQVLYKNGFAGDTEGKCIKDFKIMINEKAHKPIFNVEE